VYYDFGSSPVAMGDILYFLHQRDCILHQGYGCLDDGYYFEEDWANPTLYDIVIDMGKVAPEETVALIAKKWEEKQAG